jgi:hypothetical protein
LKHIFYFEKFGFTKKQAEAILEIKLRQLTSLEHDKLKNEEKELFELIDKLKKILGEEKEILKVSTILKPDEFETIKYNIYSNIIYATKTNDVDVLNGVSSADLLNIQQHVMGTKLLGSPQKVIAADVNNSGTVTIDDVNMLRDFVLGNRKSFNGRLWRFIKSNYVFADPKVPFPYDTTRYYPSLYSSLNSQDFIGIKLGDVNDSWSNTIARVGAAGQLVLSLPTIGANEGQEVLVPITATQAQDVAAFQFTFGFDATKAEYKGIVAGSLSDVEAVQDKSGAIRVLWLGSGNAEVKENDVLFYVKLKVNGATPLSINGAIIENEATDNNLNRLELVPVTGSIVMGKVTALSTSNPSIYLNCYPNPFADETMVTYHLPKASEVSIVLKKCTWSGVQTFHYLPNRRQTCVQVISQRIGLRYLLPGGNNQWGYPTNQVGDRVNCFSFLILKANL